MSLFTGVIGNLGRAIRRLASPRQMSGAFATHRIGLPFYFHTLLVMHHA
jgi:hypothetical protein